MSDEGEVEVTATKLVAVIPISKEYAIDLGLMEDDTPPDPAWEKKYRWIRRREAIVFAVASPLGWTSRAIDRLHTKVLNVLLWAVRVNTRVVDTEEEDDDA